MASISPIVLPEMWIESAAQMLVGNMLSWLTSMHAKELAGELHLFSLTHDIAPVLSFTHWYDDVPEVLGRVALQATINRTENK